MTAGYKAKAETVITLLNEAIAKEIECVLRYKLHYFRATEISSLSVKGGFSSMPLRSKPMPIKMIQIIGTDDPTIYRLLEEIQAKEANDAEDCLSPQREQ